MDPPSEKTDADLHGNRKMRRPYNGDENRLARWDHPEGTVAFQEAETRRSWQGKQESFLD